MTPPPRARRCGSAARDTRSAGNRLRSSTACRSASSVRGEVARARAADVVDDHVEPAVRADRGVDDGRHALGRRHVGGDTQRPRRRSRRAPALRATAASRSAGVARAQHDARALAGERERDGAADPAAGAGDERDFAGEREVHARRSIATRRSVRKRFAQPGEACGGLTIARAGLHRFLQRGNRLGAVDVADGARGGAARRPDARRPSADPPASAGRPDRSNRRGRPGRTVPRSR